MAAGGGDAQSVLLGDLGSRTSELAQRLVRLGERVARVRVQLDDRGEELGLESARQLELLRVADQHIHLGRQRERPRVEDHHLLLDPNRKWRALPEVLLDHAGKAKRLLYAAGRAVPSDEACADSVREGLAAARR